MPSTERECKLENAVTKAFQHQLYMGIGVAVAIGGPGMHSGPIPNLGLRGGVGHIICGSRAAISESTAAA